MLHSFVLVLEQTVGRKLPASSRVQFPGTITAKYFAWSTDDSNSGSLERGDFVYLSSLRMLIVSAAV